MLCNANKEHKHYDFSLRDTNFKNDAKVNSSLYGYGNVFAP